MTRRISFDTPPQLLSISADRFIEESMQISEELSAPSFCSKVCATELVEPLLNVFCVSLVLVQHVSSSHYTLFNNVDLSNRALKIGFRLPKGLLVNALELLSDLIPFTLFGGIVNGSLLDCIPQNSKHISARSTSMLFQCSQLAPNGS